jgi:hypothetical protein
VMKCPKCRTVVPKARPVKRAADRDLPELLAIIAEAAGLDAALAIANECGGQRRSFPARRFLENARSHWLVDLIGREKALLVADCFPIGSELFDIPKGPTSGAVLKYRKIKEAKVRGLSVNEIAQEVGVNRRTVFYYLAEIRREGKNK